MADILCPHCGKTNPDFLDNCQFCQNPLRPDSTLRIGDKPTKKNTGELEPVLPEWLKDVRQQARDLAEEDAAQEAARPKPGKDEPPDLLAGLAFQSENAEEEDVPDWLSSLTSTTKKEKSIPPTTSAAETDFFAQFNQSTAPQPEPVQPSQEPNERDELSDWFSKAAEEPAETLSQEPDFSQIDSGWEATTENAQVPQPSAPKEEEDLSWLRNLEDEARKTGELSKPKQDDDWLTEFRTSSSPASTAEPEDLSWLNNLGALPSSETSAQEPPSEKEDLSWLNDLGALPPTDEPASPAGARENLSWLNNLENFPQEEPPAQPVKPKEDLSWLDNLAGTHASEPPPAQPEEDLSWLNTLGEAEPSLPSSAPSASEELSWLNELKEPSEPLSSTPFTDLPLEKEQAKPAGDQPGIPHVSPFTSLGTSELNPEEDTSIPDWLKNATEAPSMPVNANQLDQFRGEFIPAGPDEPFSWKNFVPEAKIDEEETPRSEGPSFDPSLTAPLTDSSTLSNQEVDSLFSVDMPDWLSQPEPQAPETPQEEIGVHAEGGEALAPADLPSWVQAMRPVEAVISETASAQDQPAEREGPLRGLRGVLPVAAIGSARRPQPIPLKLQATAEQQANASILEQILASETSPRALASAPAFASQRMLRWVIAALVFLVLGAVVAARTQIMPISPILSADVEAAAQTLEFVPDNSNVLVVLDYEPSLAGEMEAAGSPLMNHLASLRHPRISFVTTSTNGLGLAERLMRNTDLNNPSGLAYREGENYFNLGYLPGGEAGILGFIQSPQSMLPAAAAGGFSQYSAVIMLTDHADSARTWIEQLQLWKQADPTIANQPLLVISSAQSGPMLQPYVSSRQVNGMVIGLADAARYEQKNNPVAGMARSYWDAFGAGILLAVVLIVLGSLWSLFAGLRARSAQTREA
jgi:hypothetical protein